MIELRKLTPETAELLFAVDGRRLDGESVVVRPGRNGFELSYKPLPGALWRMGSAQQGLAHDAAAWMDDANREAYLAWMDGVLAGQILLERAEAPLACVRDMRVAVALRRRGVGEAMLALAEDWGRARELCGLLAETQDANAGACQFLTRCGFTLGDIDTLRYAAWTPEMRRAAGLRESALFFYKFFKG